MPKDIPELGSVTGKVIHNRPLKFDDAHYAMINGGYLELGLVEVILADKRLSKLMAPEPDTGNITLPVLPYPPFQKAKMLPGDALHFGSLSKDGLAILSFARCPHPAPELVVMIGLPGSGKTHWVQGYARSNNPPVIISLDQLYPALSVNGRYNPDFSDVYHVMEEMGAKMALAMGKSVVVDRTNYHQRSQERWARVAKETGAKLRYVHVSRSVEQCMAEMDLRKEPSRKVPLPRMQDMADKMHVPPEAQVVKVDFWPGKEK